MRSGEIMMVAQLIRDYEKGKKVEQRGLEKLGSERAIERKNTNQY